MRNLVNFHRTTQKSENFTSRGSFCPKYKGLGKKNTEELSSMTLKSDPNFEEKLTFCLKNDMRNLINFNDSIRKSEKFAL